MLLNNPCILKTSLCLKTLTIKCMWLHQILVLHSTHCQLVCSTQTSADYQHVCGDPVSSQALVSWVERESRLVELNDVLLPSGSTTADLHFQATHSHWSGWCKLYLPHGILLRPLQVWGTKIHEILLPSPTFDVQSASVHANNNKFQGEFTIQHQTTFTLKDTANASAQILLDNPEFTSSMSNLLKKALQNRLNTHTFQKSPKMVTHQATPCWCPNTQWDPLHWTDRHSSRMSQLATEEWYPTLGTSCYTGVFSGTIKSCSCSGCWFFNDRATYQLNFIYFYWASQLLWSSEDGFTVCHMFLPTMGYTHMVYTLIIKTKHLIPSFNIHFTINWLNWINSLTSDNNR